MYKYGPTHVNIHVGSLWTFVSQKGYEKVGFFFRLKCVKGLIKIPGHYDNWKYMNSEFKKKKKYYEKYNFK
jgi:hypothetical protein